MLTDAPAKIVVSLLNNLASTILKKVESILEQDDAFVTVTK